MPIVLPADLGAVWPRVADGVAAALAPFREHTADSARDMVARQQWALWITDGGGALTTICDAPLRRVAFVIAVWGQGRGGAIVPALKEEIDHHARLCGCNAVQAVGRRGWSRSGLMPRDVRHVADLYEWSL